MKLKLNQATLKQAGVFLLIRLIATIAGSLLASIGFALSNPSDFKPSEVLGLFFMFSIFTVTYGLACAIVIDAIFHFLNKKNQIIRGILFVAAGTLIPIIGNLVAALCFLSLLAIEWWLTRRRNRLSEAI